MAMPCPSAEMSDVIALLGGRKTLGLAPRAQADFIEILRAGLPYDALRAVATELALSLEDVQSVLQLSPRDFRRRKAARLTSVASERVLRLARVAVHASYVLGNRAAARRWLNHPNRALAGDVPVSLLDTDVGTEEVREVLDRVRFGVYT